MRPKQFTLLKDQPKAYGGELLKTRKARSVPRPLATQSTLHLVLRSSQATGEWSFRKIENRRAIGEIIAKFSQKYGVKVLSLANVGNHLHMQIKLSNRFTYKKFIRAITGAIVMAVTKVNKFLKLKKHFWDFRPFTRVVVGLRAVLNLKNYIDINKFEGHGISRAESIDLNQFYQKWRSKAPL